MKIKKIVINGILWSLLDKVVNQLGVFATTIYIAKKIGPESFGLVGILSVFIIIADGIINNGFGQALVQKNYRATRADFSTIFYTSIFTAFVLYILLYILLPYIGIWVGNSSVIGAGQVLFLVIIINSFSVVNRAKLSIELNFKLLAIVNFISGFVAITGAIFTLSLVGGYWAMVTMMIIRSLTCTVLFCVFIRWLPKWEFSFSSLRRLFSFGFYLMLSGILSATINNLYILFIARNFSTLQAGYLSQATNQTNMISGLIISVLQGVTYPLLSSINEDREQLLAVYTKLIRITSLISFPALLGFAAIAKPLTMLFLGAEWESIIPIITILAFAKVITPLSTVNIAILNAIGRSDLFFKIDVLKLPMTIVGLIISVNYGVTSVSIALLITTYIAFFFNAYYSGKLFNIGAIVQLQIAIIPIISSLVMFGICSYLSGFIISYLELIILIIFGGVMYFFFLYILGGRKYFNIF